MNNYLYELKKEILRAGLSKAKHHDLVKIFASLDIKEQAKLLELIKEKPGFVKKISELIDKKKVAFSAKNSSLWEEIVKEEELLIMELKD